MFPFHTEIKPRQASLFSREKSFCFTKKMATSHFELPIYSLLKDSKIPKTININLNKIIPQDVRNPPNYQENLQKFESYDNSFIVSTFKFSTNIINIKGNGSTNGSTTGSSNKPNNYLWRTPSPDTLCIFDLYNKSSIKIVLTGLTSYEFILPKVDIIWKDEFESYLVFMLNTGYLFKVHILPSSQTNKILENINSELFEFKKSVFVINDRSNISDKSPNQGNNNTQINSQINPFLNFTFTDFEFMSDSKILLRNNSKCFYYEIFKNKKPSKYFSIGLNTASNIKRRKLNSPQQKNNNTHRSNVNKSFFSNVFFNASSSDGNNGRNGRNGNSNDRANNSNSSTCSQDGGNFIIDVKYHKSYLYFIQSDGLFRKFKFILNEKIFREIEAKYLIRELTVGNSNLSDSVIYDFTHVKIYPEFNKVVTVYEDLDSNYTNTVNDSFTDIDYSHEIAIFELRSVGVKEFYIFRLITGD